MYIETIEIIKFTVIMVFIMIATITDYREYKIKNKYVLIFLTVGLVLNGVVSGLTGLCDSVMGLLLPLLLLPLFALGMLGGGDIKALCAIGSIAGLKMSMFTVLFSIIAGGVIALGFMIFRRNARERMRQFVLYMKQCFYMRKLLPYDQFTDEKSGFRFSLGILGGFIIAVIWMHSR